MEATIIYPHQLFEHSPALAKANSGECIAYLVEEPLLLTYNPAHVSRLLLHRLSMQAYKETLEKQSYKVRYLEISSLPNTEAVFERLDTDGVKVMHIVDTTDTYLEEAIDKACKKHLFKCQRYESPMFILEKQAAKDRFLKSKRFMASFYKQLRQDKDILMEKGKPLGGKYSFDAANREKLPAGISLPDDIEFFGSADTAKAEDWLATFKSERYGEVKSWVPYTHEGAQKFFQEFLRARFQYFGPYEDALTTRHTRLFHSAISPLLNIGLLTPQYVLDEAITYAAAHDVPINSLEGFVRQILGWREFIRASYEVDGSTMRSNNFFNHTGTLPKEMWTASTGLAPLDHVITTALSCGYTHHIERLMVMGNFMLLSQIHPDEVYRWFMGMYIDAYDWVMVPNVYGMSQYADGASFATKPYISGSNYLNNMSDYENGDWEELWTALYWNFIHEHKEFFEHNNRLSMMPRTLMRMKQEVRESHLERAQDYLAR